MRNKNDDLLSLAFGELSAEAARAAEVRAAADPAARAELEAFRELRTSLQHLPPPPSDNLSTERLRAAILDRELKIKRAAGFNWGWAPMALAACAAVIFVARPGRRVEPQLVTVRTPEIADTTFARAPDFKSILKEVPPVPMAKSVVAGIEPTVQPERSRARRRPAVRRQLEREPLNRRANLVAANWGEKISEVFDAGPKQASFPAPQSQTIAPPPSKVEDLNRDEFDFAGKKETVVLVGDKRDLETGATAATGTEVGNVLVGG